MEFTEKDLAEAIAKNDAAWVAARLDEFKLLPGTDYPTGFGYDSWNFTSTLLAYASAAEMAGRLNVDLAEELLERTAKVVDVFSLVRLVISGLGIKPEQWYNGVSRQARSALRNNEFDEYAAEDIEGLDRENFKALLIMITTEEVPELDVNFTLPILRYIYECEMMPRALLLAYVGLSLRPPAEEMTLQLTVPARELAVLEMTS